MGKEIDKIRSEMEDDGVIEENTKKSTDWLVKNIIELTEGKSEALIRELKRTSDVRVMPRIGKFYMFSYLAKHRETLPYFDRFPLIIVLSINYKEKYMTGLNMHYLPLNMRGKLFKGILMFLNNKRWDETTRFKVSWKLLDSLSVSPFIQPAIKRYNFEQLRSRFIAIEEDEWDIALMLPTHIFKGIPITEVWADSIAIVRQNAPPPKPKIKKPTTIKKKRNTGRKK